MANFLQIFIQNSSSCCLVSIFTQTYLLVACVVVILLNAVSSLGDYRSFYLTIRLASSVVEETGLNSEVGVDIGKILLLFLLWGSSL